MYSSNQSFSLSRNVSNWLLRGHGISVVCNCGAGLVSNPLCLISYFRLLWFWYSRNQESSSSSSEANGKWLEGRFDIFIDCDIGSVPELVGCALLLPMLCSRCSVFDIHETTSRHLLLLLSLILSLTQDNCVFQNIIIDIQLFFYTLLFGCFKTFEF